MKYGDLIDRQAAIEAIDAVFPVDPMKSEYAQGIACGAALAKTYVEQLPSAQPDVPDINVGDMISRHAVLDWLNDEWDGMVLSVFDGIRALPSAQPERTCVNCGRTVNNGGWYADGRTRCPIEEHYALPKDGFCHLWEKRNVTDDDYPERMEE